MADVTIPGLTALTSIDRAADLFEVSDTSDSGNSKKTTINNMLNVTSQPMAINDVQSVTNKTLDNTNTITLKDTLFTLQDDADTTKQAKFQLSGITTATTRTYTLPNASSTLVDLTSTQSLSGKTLTSPTITSPTITNPTLTVDTISEFTAANGVTIDGLRIKDSALVTANSVPNNTLSNTGAFGSAWAWTSYVPTFTNFTIGNGTVVASYTQIGKTVLARGFVTLGTTSAMAVQPIMSLPVASSTSVYVADRSPLGTSSLNDTGTAEYESTVKWKTSTTAALWALNAAGTYATNANINSTAPFTWTSSDTFSWSIFYETA